MVHQNARELSEPEEKLLAALVQTFPSVRDEFMRAMFKHGGVNTPANPLQDDKSRLMILVEEIGEVGEVCVCNNLLVKVGRIARFMTYDEGDRTALKDELVQVATMALAAYVGIELSASIEKEV